MTADPSIAAQIHGRGSRAQRRYLEVCVQAASHLELPVYLVGGAVRDFLLTGIYLDLDVVVVGDGLAVAREVAERLDGELVVHRRFLTAEVRFEDSHMDFVTARHEIYENPAELPVVTPGTLNLERRDFTVNAMAVPLWPSEVEELVDPFAGRLDLERRLLRVLYEDSFFDDPTRILRGVRLGSRLQMSLEAGTADLAKAAIEADAFEPLSNSRLRHELIMVLEDQEVEKSLRELEILGFLQVLGRLEPIYKEQWQSLSAVITLHSEWGGKGPPIPSPRWWLVYLMSLWQSEGVSSRSNLAKALGLDGSLAALLEVYPDNLEMSRELLANKEISPHVVCRVLEDLAPEETALLMAVSREEVKQWIRRWIEELRDVRLIIGGVDLKRAGFSESPALGQALAATLEARLDGVITVGQELAFAVDLLRAEAD